MNVSVGTILNQRFRLDALERRDALGEDYAALDLKRNLGMRIKVLRNSLPNDPALLTFQPGNSTLQTLNHPHIVPFYGLFQEQDRSFLVERFIDGYPLREHLLEQRGQPIPVADAMIYLKALCSAIGYAQGFGIVHCNISPANVWLEHAGNILLGGFGLARSIDTRMTSTGLAGPPAYLAPEMLQGHGISPASDIYCLGLILFELITGQHPFLGIMKSEIPAMEAERLGEAQLRQMPPNPRTLNPAVPEGLAQVVLTALAKSPRERYQSTQEMFEIACAMYGRNPDAILDRFGAPAGSEPTIMGMAPLKPPLAPTPPQTLVSPPVYPPVYLPPTPATQVMPQPGYPPQTPATQVMPGYSATGQPATQVMPGAFNATGQTPTMMMTENDLSAYGAPVQERAPSRRRPSGLVLVGIIVGILACLAIAGGGILWLGTQANIIQLASDTPVPSSTSIPTAASLPPTATNAPEQVIPPSATFAPPPLPPTATMPPAPTVPPTAPPTDTPPPPTATLRPTTTLPQGSFVVTIRNNLSFPVFAFRDGVLMGSDPIPPHMYIFYRNISAGRHVFTVCSDPNGSSCRESKTVNVDQDLTVAFP